jgi:hypothetical protein
MANNRIFYAIQAVGIKTTDGSTTGDITTATWVKGIQSVGVTTNFTLDQAYELGQLEVYANNENVADVEVTLNKVLDGKTLLYTAAGGSSVDSNIVAAGNNKSALFLAIYPDSESHASGVASVIMHCSGMYIGSVGYTFPVDGNATEDLTLVGNSKSFYTGAQIDASLETDFAAIDQTPDEPNNGLVRRQNIILESSVFPTSALAASRGASGGFQSISISADFGRDNIYELGSYKPYYKFASYPITVTCDFEMIATTGDQKGISTSNAPTLTDETIKIYAQAGSGAAYEFDLGTKNKLTSVNYTGGDTGGGNATVTFSYQGFNKLLVSTLA